LIEEVLRSIEAGRRVLQERFEVKQQLKVLESSALQLSYQAVSEAHRGNLSAAEKLLQENQGIIRQILSLIERFPDFERSVRTVLQEYAEAAIVVAFMRREKLPSHEALGIPVIPYLCALGDVVGELRRYALNAALHNRLDNAFAALQIMESLYDALLSLTAIYAPEVSTLRHKCDVARRLVEDLRSVLVKRGYVA